jgi:hypothetical protein
LDTYNLHNLDTYLYNAPAAQEKGGKEQRQPSGYHSGVTEDSSLMRCDMM